MKYLFNFCLIITTLLFVGCSDDENLQVSEGSFGNILTPEAGQSIVLNPLEEQTNTAITISWEDADYSVPTQVNYTVEIAAAGTSFENPIAVGNTITNVVTVNIANFNGYVVQAGLFPFTEGDLEMRIKSTVGDQNTTLPQYTNPITIAVTPFTTDLPKIAVPGNHQGWDPPNAPLLASSAFGETDYEGYVWLDGEYKFLAPNQTGVFDWGNTDWGDDGSFTGVLVDIADESNCNAEVAGYYFVQADTNELTYSATMYNWAVTGSATPLGWPAGPDGTIGQDQDMTYDPVSKTWTITLNLTAEEIKFRANDAWAWAYGDNDADGSLESVGGAANIAVPAQGNYTVILDLSNPREYTYSLILN